MTKRICLALSVLLLAFLPAGEVEAQRTQNRPNAEAADRAIDVLRSPYCPGVMLRVCTSPPAATLRDTLFTHAAGGMESEELVDWMLARYGEEYLALPPRSGMGLLAWVIPPLAILLAMVAILGWFRAQRGPSAPESDPTVSPVEMSEADREVLTAALRDWKETGEEDV